MATAAPPLPHALAFEVRADPSLTRPGRARVHCRACGGRHDAAAADADTIIAEHIRSGRWPREEQQ